MPIEPNLPQHVSLSGSKNGRPDTSVPHSASDDSSERSIDDDSVAESNPNLDSLLNQYFYDSWKALQDHDLTAQAIKKAEPLLEPWKVQLKSAFVFTIAHAPDAVKNWIAGLSDIASADCIDDGLKEQVSQINWDNEDHRQVAREAAEYLQTLTVQQQNLQCIQSMEKDFLDLPRFGGHI